MPGNGFGAGDGSEPGGSVDPAGAGRLPAFLGLSSRGPQFTNGSQGVRGGDGPGGSVLAGGANGGLPGRSGNGSEGGEGLAGSGGADFGRVSVPPADQQGQRLPIFDSLESDWFRRSGQPVTAAARVQGPLAVPGVQGPAAGVQGSVPGVPGSWTSPSDEGWRAAEAVAEPAAGEKTQAGLPRRVPRANLVPGSVGGGGVAGGQDSAAGAPVRSPDVVRSRMSSFQRGVREGRAAAPPQTEESQD